MIAALLDGKILAGRIREQVKTDVDRLTADSRKMPGLATILVGDDAASHVYVANKRRLATGVGMADFHRHLGADSTHQEIADTIAALAADERVSGILLQLPLPDHLDSSQLIDLSPASKDVDGLTTVSAGLLSRGRSGLRPCTPSGVLELLDDANVTLDGAHAVVVGRSQLVGAPVARLLLDRNATVTVAHSRTKDLASLTREADILIAAAGVPGLIGREHVRPGAVVIDVGIHRVAGRLVGDVRFEEVKDVAGWITPVPGGVGPMTIAMLLANTVRAARGSIGDFAPIGGRS
jgi:methylenetetrahydrofolate dehydrogenase (NADP+)/methenyltetrahydrofolate cyclohydrolase